MTYATPVTLVQPCPPHEWGHAPTVGYYHCMKCRRTVMHNEPEYAEIEADQAAALRSHALKEDRQ